MMHEEEDPRELELRLEIEALEAELASWEKNKEEEDESASEQNNEDLLNENDLIALQESVEGLEGDLQLKT